MAFGDLITSPPQSQASPATVAVGIDMLDETVAVAGDLLVFCHHVSNGTQLVPTDDGSGSWLTCPAKGVDGSGGEYRIFYKVAIGDEQLITGNSSSSDDHLAILYHLEGPWKSPDPFDVDTKLQEQSGTAFDTGATASTSVPDAMAIVIAGGEPTDLGITIGTWQDSYIEDIDPSTLQAPVQFMGSAHKLLTATGAARGQATWSATNEDGVGVIAVFSKDNPQPKYSRRNVGGFYG